MESRKLWQAKRKVIEAQVGFSLCHYVNLCNTKSDQEFVFDLFEAIVIVRKIIELWNSDLGYWPPEEADIIEILFCQLSQSGMIGLALALGYGKSLL